MFDNHFRFWSVYQVFSIWNLTNWQTFVKRFAWKNGLVVTLFEIIVTHFNVSEILYINRPIRPKLTSASIMWQNKRYNIIYRGGIIIFKSVTVKLYIKGIESVCEYDINLTPVPNPHSERQREDIYGEQEQIREGD